MSFIEIEHVSYRYPAQGGAAEEEKTEEKGRLALDDVSLSIEEGEFVAILGTNGSGKSTLAKQMNALLLPGKGHVRVAGMDTQETDDLWKIREQVGMVFQNPDNQLIAASVEDDVAFGPENLGVESAEICRRVHEALEAVQMTHFRTAAPHLLSGGQKQRVAIAGALAMRTKGLVLDEATAMLDPQGRTEVMDCVRRIHEEQGITILYITHFMEEAALADRVFVMHDGRLVMQGKPRYIFARGEELKRLGLDVPFAAELGARLRKAGFAIPEGILTKEELADACAQLYVDNAAGKGGEA